MKDFLILASIGCFGFSLGLCARDDFPSLTPRMVWILGLAVWVIGVALSRMGVAQ